MTAPRDWQDLTHSELYAAVHSGPGPGASMPAERMWQELAGIVEAAEARMHAAAARSAEAWQGEGGDAARSGLSTLNAWVLGAVTDAQTTLHSLSDQGRSARELTLLMQPPNTQELAAARDEASTQVEDADVQRGLLGIEQQARANEEDARRHMEYYYFVSVENRRNLDFWTTPPTVVVETASTSTAGGGGGVGSGSGGGGSISAALSGGGGGRVGGPEVPGFAGVPPVPGSVPAGVPGGGPDGAGGPGVGGVGPSGVPVGGGSPGGGPPGGGSIGPGVPGPGGFRPGPGSPGPGSAGAGAPGGGPTGSGPLAGGLPGPAPTSGVPAGGGGPPAAVPGRGTAPPTSRDALPPGAGGRGPRIPSGSEPGTTLPRGGTGTPGGPGFRPAVAGPQPLPGASPTWRDLVDSQRGPNGGPVAGPTEPAPGNRGGPGPTAPRPGLPAAAEAAVRSTGGGYGAGHGMYPPMGGAAGNQGEGRRRPSYLIDDSGAFEVNVPYTDPVIGGPDLPSDPRDR